MMPLVRVRIYEDYFSIQRQGQTAQFRSYPLEGEKPPADYWEIIDFLEYCEEKGRVYRLGQSTVYEIDPNFKTL